MREPSVAILDVDLPPGLAFVRSLGSAGVPVRLYSHERFPVGRFSRHSKEFGRSPRVHDTDAIIGFLTDGLVAGEFDLIAPTSDYVAFAAAEAFHRAGITRDSGFASREQLHDCLFKDRFALAFARAGFPSLPTESPLSLGEAIDAAGRLGFPLVVKPRSHVGVGVHRGAVVRNITQLTEAFVRSELRAGQQGVLAVDEDVALPVVQRYLDPRHTDVVSITGVLDRDGAPLAIGHCVKTHQWPPRLGVGTRFEALPDQPFTEAAVAAVRDVLGSGIFELELLVDRRSGEFWAIDLNPRAFGQISLDIASGRDLPSLWYQSVSRRTDISSNGARRNPTQWRLGVQYHAGILAQLRYGPSRVRTLWTAFRGLAAPKVGAVWHGRDPAPAWVWTVKTLRHPGGLFRPYVREARGERRRLSRAWRWARTFSVVQVGVPTFDILASTL